VLTTQKLSSISSPTRLLSLPVRVHVVDPSAYTPPYDHALCRALAAAGAEVELFTSRFAYGAVPAPEGYERRETFYRLAHRGGASGQRSRSSQALKLIEHVPDMLRYRRAARVADIVHFQWLTVQPLDVHLLPRRRPAATEAGRHAPSARSPVSAKAGRHAPAASIPVSASMRPKLVLTAHDVLPREPRPGQLAAQRRLYERFDAVVVHSEHGRVRLLELGVDPERLHVIPHGALTHLAGPGALTHLAGLSTAPRAGGQIETRVGEANRLPSNTASPVVLFFGLLRPYKGLDVLLRAWRGMESRPPGSRPPAELWIVGMPRMDLRALDAAHGGVLGPASLPCLVQNPQGAYGKETSGPIRLVPRFIPDAELPAYFKRADLVVLPYLEADQSGVLFTALAFGKPLLLSDVGGFPEVAATGAARTVPAGDSAALGEALRELLADPAALSAMAERARAAAAGPYSWDAIAQRTLKLYRSLCAQPR
jgi:glycosyltransferase involved in cell wall biosynthesis